MKNMHKNCTDYEHVLSFVLAQRTLGGKVFIEHVLIQKPG